MEPIGPIFDVLKCLADPTCKYIDHYKKLEERMNDLQTRADELNTLKRDTELRIRAELRWGKILTEEVEKWLLDVNHINDEMQAINQRVQTVSCFSRARLGKRVAQTVERVERIIQRGRFTEALVIDNPSTAGVPFQLEHLEGETMVKAKIWNYLMGDEIVRIGVCGMGGIGKTTITKHIYNQLLKESKALFDRVIWVTVSKELNITKLQQDIAQAMRIADLPEPEQERVAALEDKLRQERYVLILDDVWQKFSLVNIGITSRTLSNRSKVVLTSRSIEVSRSMDCEIVKVLPLSNDESKNLFLEHVGRGVLKVPSLMEILDQVVKECGGLPLAIVVIAGSMKGIYDVHEWKNALRELREHVRSLKGTDDEIYGRLKFSYDRLEDSKIQNCFLYCSLYPEDHIISRLELIEYWIDEEFLGIGSRQELYDRGHATLNKLVNNCLLEKGADRDGVKMHDVMRDTALYIKSFSPRFMVKAGMRLKELPSEQEWGEDLEKVSLMMNSLSEIPSYWSPSCAILSTLFLQNNWSIERIPESFFQRMHRLSTLDLSYTNIEQLPNSVSSLEKLKALVLRACRKLRYVPSLEKLKALRKLDLCSTAIERVPHGLEMLVNLTYLNLFTKCLQELPIEILFKLSCLQYLVLYLGSNTIKMNGREAAGLRKLETFVVRFHELVEFNNYCESIQVQRLTSYLLVMAPPEAEFDTTPLDRQISQIKIQLPTTGGMEAKMKKICSDPIGAHLYNVVLNRQEGVLLMTGLVENNSGMGRKLLKVIGTDGSSIEPDLSYLLPGKYVILSGCQIRREDPIVLPTDLESLRIFECRNVRSLTDISLFFQKANELRWCSIHDCKEIESVLDLSSSSSPGTPFQNLEFLWLDGLDNLHKLVKVGEASVVSTSSSLPLPLPLPGTFSHLKSFRIERCSNMKRLFPFELVLDLRSLEKLVVRNCGQMVEIIASKEEEENHKGKGTYSPTTLTLPKLRELELKKLPKLKSICSSNGVIICDSLEDIVVRKCPILKRIPLKIPFIQDPRHSFSHPLTRTYIDSEKLRKSIEWDYSSAKNILQPCIL